MQGIGTPPRARGGGAPTCSEALGTPAGGDPSPTVSTPDVAPIEVIAEEKVASKPSQEAAIEAEVSASASPAPGIPSVGSAGHSSGECKPCAFLHTKGCENGYACQFCHLCDAGEKKRRRREKQRNAGPSSTGAALLGTPGGRGHTIPSPYALEQLTLPPTPGPSERIVTATPSPVHPLHSYSAAPPLQPWPDPYAAAAAASLTPGLLAPPLPLGPYPSQAPAILQPWQMPQIPQLPPWWSTVQTPVPATMQAASIESTFQAEQVRRQQEMWAEEMQREYLSRKALAAEGPNDHAAGSPHEKTKPTPYERLVSLVAGGALTEANPSEASPQRPELPTRGIIGAGAQVLASAASVNAGSCGDASVTKASAAVGSDGSENRPPRSQWRQQRARRAQ